MVTNLQCSWFFFSGQIDLHYMNEHIFRRISVKKFFHGYGIIFFTVYSQKKNLLEIGEMLHGCTSFYSLQEYKNKISDGLVTTAKYLVGT